MTRVGYRLLLALLVSFALGGVLAAAPVPTELGLVPSMSCEEWFADPRASGVVRLEGCTVDLFTTSFHERLDGQGLESAVVQVRPAGWTWDDAVETGPAQLLWHTTDPEVLSLVDRGRRSSDEAYVRFAERYASRLLRVRPVVGSIVPAWSDPSWAEHVVLHGATVAELPWVAEEQTRSPTVRAAGLLALALALLGLAMLVGFQRRWDRRRAALLGQGTEPKRF